MSFLNPTAYWNFDENTGTSTSDVTGNGHAGTLSGSSIPTWTTGVVGSGLNMNGTASGGGNSYVSVADSTDWNFGTSDFTISLWVTPLNTSGYYAIFDSGYDQGKGILIEYDITASLLRIYMGTTVVHTISYALFAAYKYHIVIERLGTSLTCFINGTGISSVANAVNVINSGVSINIGRYAGGGENVDGMMDAIGIWKGYGLTFAEITELYNVVQYPFTSGNMFLVF